MRISVVEVFLFRRLRDNLQHHIQGITLKNTVGLVVFRSAYLPAWWRYRVSVDARCR
jgi:hypothetical protein